MDSLCAAAPPSRVVVRPSQARGTSAAAAGRSSPSKPRSSSAIERAPSPAKTARRIVRRDVDACGSADGARIGDSTTAAPPTSRAARSAIARRSLEAGDGLLLDAAAARAAADPRKEALRNSVLQDQTHAPPSGAELDAAAASRARRVARERGTERARRASPPRAASPVRDSVAAQARCNTSPFKVAMSSRCVESSSSSSSRTRIEATRTAAPATRPATLPTSLRSLAAARAPATMAERTTRPVPLEATTARREREVALSSAAPSSSRAPASREHLSSPVRPRSGAVVVARQRETSEAGTATRPSARRVPVLPGTSSSAAPPSISRAPAGTPPRATLPRPAHATAWRASPGRAQRGVFVHEAESESASASASVSVSESDDELADCSPCKTMPPASRSSNATRPRVQRSPASYPARSSASSSSSTSPTSSPPHQTAAAAAPTLSPETSSALASLEASLARLALPKHARRRTIGSSAALLQPHIADVDPAAAPLSRQHVSSSQVLSSPARRTLDSPTRRTLESPTCSERLAVGSSAGGGVGVGRVRPGGSLFALAKAEPAAPVDAAAAAETAEAQREARRAARKLAQREMQREADDAAQAAIARARAAEAREAQREAEEEEQMQQQRALRRQEGAQQAQQAQAQTQAMRVVEAQKERRRVARQEAAAKLAREAMQRAADEEEAAAQAEADAQVQAEAQRRIDDDERAAAAERAQAKASRLAARLAAIRLERPGVGDEKSGTGAGERRHTRRQSLQLVQSSAATPAPGRGEIGDDGSLEQKVANKEEARAASPPPATTGVTARVQRRRSMYTYVPTQRVAATDGAGDASTRSLATASSASSERFLRGVVVLVDVRDQDGSDASARWIEQLRAAGARVSSRAPAAGSDAAARLTHIVFKSGRPATLHAFRALPNDARPALVGVNWIRQCLEERRRVDEAPFLVELGKQAVFQKRRTSMAPRLAPGLDCASPFRGTIAKEVEAARKRELVHRPAVPSPLAGSAWRPDVSTDGSEAAL